MGLLSELGCICCLRKKGKDPNPRPLQNQEMQGQTYSNKTIPKKEGVIITVYVESPKKQNKNSHQNSNPLNKIKPNAPPKSRGYDRRAQLLAYSRHLRNVDSSVSQLPKSKSKIWKWKFRSKEPAERRLPSRRALQRWRYQRIGMMREEVVDQACGPKCCGGSNKKSSGKSGSSIFRKLKSLLGELSKGCKT